MTPTPARRLSPAELQAHDKVCERLAGFDPQLHYESVDGLLCALAAAPRLPPGEEWLPALFGDTFDRTFADPEDRGQALAALQARLAVLCSQLDAESLFDDPDALRLDPFLAQWDDEARARAAAEDGLALAAVPRTGEDFARGFLRGVQALPALWTLPPEEEARAAFEGAFAHLHALLLPEGSAELQAHIDAAYAGKTPPTRDELLTEACYAVQDLRLFWVDFAPVPPTRRVAPQPGRNDPCPCGSGRKYKKCHGAGAA